MNAVRKQSQAPPPIPFPWEARFARVLSIPPAIQPLWHAASWVLRALVTTVVSLLFSWRFVSRIA